MISENTHELFADVGNGSELRVGEHQKRGNSYEREGALSKRQGKGVCADAGMEIKARFRFNS